MKKQSPLADAAQKTSPALILLLSATTGLAVATIYLLQPLLQTVSQSLLVPLEAVGLIVTLTQAGYGLGILFLIPLGDVLPKKSLILTKLGFLILALALTALSGTYPMILISSLLVGVFATTAQDIVPFSADLAEAKDRGAVVGQVMSGLLLGILLSRTASGFIADLLGWRAVFWVTALGIGAVALVLALVVRPHPRTTQIPYGALLQSTLRNFTEIPELRRAIITQGLLGLAFSAFWTNLSFYVGRPPFDMSTTQIGMFGLAGAAGALAAPLAGKLADRKGPQMGILLGAALVVLAFLLMRVAPLSVFLLFAGAIIFDLGIQMALVSHQSIIYALNPSARARLNALFVACMFGAFAFGSLLSVRLFASGGWTAVLNLCAGSSLIAIGLALLQHRRKLGL